MGAGFVGPEEGVEGVFERECGVDVALGVGVEDLALLLGLRAHEAPPAPLEVVVAADGLQDLALAVLALDIHIIMLIIIGTFQSTIIPSALPP